MSKKVLIFIIVLAGFGILFFVNPEASAFMPRCPFNWLTGLDCPACGTQRALHHLFHLQVREAFAYNPFLIISFPYLFALVLCQWFNDGGRFDALKRVCHHHVVVNVYLVLLVAWWILRNVL